MTVLSGEECCTMDWISEKKLMILYALGTGIQNIEQEFCPGVKKRKKKKEKKKTLSLAANKRQIRPANFLDFTVMNIIDTQATLNSRPFLAPHSNTQQHNNSFFVCNTTDWNHPSGGHVKATNLTSNEWSRPQAPRGQFPHVTFVSL